MSRVTVSAKIETINEIKDRARTEFAKGTLTFDEFRAVEMDLSKREYRVVYNERADVKAKRKAYNRARLEEQKLGRQLIEQLLAEKRG